MKKNIILLSLIALIFGCQSPSQNQDTEVETEANAETEKTVSESVAESTTSEWVSLFDGETTNGWRNFKSETIGEQWQVEEGMLTLTEKGGGDIVTENQYENFELELEWKISEGGNSGIFFHVVEADSLETVWRSGPEMQILDNERHKDAKIDKHRAGDNYDLQACSEETVKPAGEWNKVKLVVNEGHVEHWLNEVKVVEYQLWSEEWEAMYAASKFSKMPMYGRGKKGHIALQDHGDKVWFKNIRIKTL